MERNVGQRDKMQVHSDFVGKDFITGDISSSSGIAIGRGAKAVVVRQPTASAVEEFAEPLTLGFDDLVTQVEESDLPPALKESLQGNLESLQAEVERAEAGDVGVARRTLETISEVMPELRQPLWYWLDEVEHVSTPIKIVARNLLT